MNIDIDIDFTSNGVRVNAVRITTWKESGRMFDEAYGRVPKPTGLQKYNYLAGGKPQQVKASCLKEAYEKACESDPQILLWDFERD